MISKRKYYVTVALLAAVCVLSFGVGKLSVIRSSKLTMLEHMIDEYFPLDYDKEASTDLAAYAYTSALGDPYTEYFTAEDYAEFNRSLSSVYKGIGVTIDYSSGSPVITEIYRDSPAAKAGIAVGDILLSVDSLSLNEETYNDVIYYITGASENSPEDGKSMHFTFMRDGKSFECNMARSEYSVPEVTSQMLDGNIFYISLSSFTESSAEKFTEAMTKAENASALIIDLRDNPGGLVTSLMDISTLIMPEGLVFSSVDASEKKEEYKIDDNDYCSLPLAVLINGNSASASEIFSSAVKESGRGTLIGNTTYGKGLVQVLIPFDDGSALKLTEAKYYTRNGNYINDIGISPDIKIDGWDEQLNAAIDFLNGESSKK